MTDYISASDNNSPAAKPHRRRPRYSVKHPRRFEEKYKEHDPQRYADTIAKVVASGKTPAARQQPRALVYSAAAGVANSNCFAGFAGGLPGPCLVGQSEMPMAPLKVRYGP